MLLAGNYRLGSFVPMQGDSAATEQLIAVTPDIGLRLDQQSRVTFDVPALRTALHSQPVESWSGTPFDMPEELELVPANERAGTADAARRASRNRSGRGQPHGPQMAPRRWCVAAASRTRFGYGRNEQATAETFGGEWFHTKDAARQDEDGYIWYEGRADDVIIAAGYRIGPFEVESACIEHPAVLEAAAVASPDALRGNVVKAFIVLAEGHQPSDELAEDIKGFVRARLSAYAYPRKLEFVNELPKTLTGKIRRVELRERERTPTG